MSFERIEKSEVQVGNGAGAHPAHQERIVVAHDVTALMQLAKGSQFGGNLLPGVRVQKNHLCEGDCAVDAFKRLHTTNLICAAKNLCCTSLVEGEKNGGLLQKNSKTLEVSFKKVDKKTWRAVVAPIVFGKKVPKWKSGGADQPGEADLFSVGTLFRVLHFKDAAACSLAQAGAGLAPHPARRRVSVRRPLAATVSAVAFGGVLCGRWVCLAT